MCYNPNPKGDWIMAVKDHGKRKNCVDVLCPVCQKTVFPQRPDGRPKTCSRKCARTLEWTRVERQEIVSAGSSGYLWHFVGHEHPNNRNGYILEHRYQMEKKLGRFLEPHERVHHKDGNRVNNTPENLELWMLKKKDPAGVRASDYHCAGCRCFHDA
jgi:hypothetical protein